MKLYETAMKVSGWNLRLRAIGSFITGIILIVIGIVIAAVTEQYGGLIFCLIGAIAILGGWFYWRRSKALMEGRFYKKEEEN